MTFCAICGSVREPSELLEATNTRSGAVRFVCRPSIRPGCFGRLDVRAAESIRALVPNTGRHYPDREPRR